MWHFIHVDDSPHAFLILVALILVLQFVIKLLRAASVLDLVGIHRRRRLAIFIAIVEPGRGLDLAAGTPAIVFLVNLAILGTLQAPKVRIVLKRPILVVKLLIDPSTRLPRLPQIGQALHLLGLVRPLSAHHVQLPELVELPEQDLIVALLYLQLQLQLIVLVDDLRHVHVQLVHLLLLHLQLLPLLVELPHHVFEHEGRRGLRICHALLGALLKALIRVCVVVLAASAASLVLAAVLLRQVAVLDLALKH